MSAAPRIVRWLDGVDYPLDALARKLDIGVETLRYRLRAGWPLERIAAAPCRGYTWRARRKASPSDAREARRGEQVLDDAVRRECAPPWERHPQPWD